MAKVAVVTTHRRLAVSLDGQLEALKLARVDSGQIATAAGPASGRRRQAGPTAVPASSPRGRRSLRAGIVDHFRRVQELPGDCFYHAYVIDLRGQVVGDWSYPQVLVPEARESLFVFGIGHARDLGRLGVLPPRSVVVALMSGGLGRALPLIAAELEHDAQRKGAASGGLRRVSLAPDGSSLRVTLASGTVMDAVLPKRIECGAAVMAGESAGEPEREPSGGPAGEPVGEPAGASAGRPAASIGARIRTERKRRGLTLAELGALAGMTRSNVARLEAGRHAPTTHTLERVAAALQIPVAFLV